jgi:hypothetical protein
MRAALVVSMALVLSCGTTASQGNSEDAGAEASADVTAEASPEASADVVGYCLVDPTGERWICTDSTHATATEVHECAYRCGDVPCSGESTDPTGPVTECLPGTHCVVDVRYSDGAVTSGPCQPP